MIKYYLFRANTSTSTAGVKIYPSEDKRSEVQAEVVRENAQRKREGKPLLCDILFSCNTDDDIIDALKKYSKPVELRRALANALIGHVNDEKANIEPKKTMAEKVKSAIGLTVVMLLLSFGFISAQCSKPYNVSINDCVGGVSGCPYDGIGVMWCSNDVGLYSIAINGVWYTQPAFAKDKSVTILRNPLSNDCSNGIITSCDVWKYYHVSPFKVGQNVVITIRSYCSYPSLYDDSFYTHQITSTMCKK